MLAEFLNWTLHDRAWQFKYRASEMYVQTERSYYAQIMIFFSHFLHQRSQDKKELQNIWMENNMGDLKLCQQIQCLLTDNSNECSFECRTSTIWDASGFQDSTHAYTHLGKPHAFSKMAATLHQACAQKWNLTICTILYQTEWRLNHFRDWHQQTRLLEGNTNHTRYNQAVWLPYCRV